MNVLPLLLGEEESKNLIDLPVFLSTFGHLNLYRVHELLQLPFKSPPINLLNARLRFDIFEFVSSLLARDFNVK
jgi:hypothetical protein